MRPLPIDVFAGAPAYVLGLSVVRGHAIPVVDIGALLQGDHERDTRRFLVVRAGPRPLALAVEEVVGIRAFATGSIGALPPLLDLTRAGVVQAIGTHDRELLLVLGAGRLVPDDAWRAVDARGGVA